MNTATLGVLAVIVILGLLFVAAFIWVLIDTVNEAAKEVIKTLFK